MKNIQEEIDKVVGSDRAPTWEDEMKLPYLRASIKGDPKLSSANLRTSAMASSEQIWNEPSSH
jgi:Cytochrome P450